MLTRPSVRLLELIKEKIPTIISENDPELATFIDILGTVLDEMDSKTEECIDRD